MKNNSIKKNMKSFDEISLYSIYPQILEKLLFDNTTKNYLIWATSIYSNKGKGYKFFDFMKPDLIIINGTKLINHRVLKSKSEKETKELGKKLSLAIPKGSVISLRGSLGAGKTVFAKGFAEGLNITEAIVSPTFTLVQEYDGRYKMYHLDLYRLSGEDEFESMGGEDFLYPDGVTLIEWSEKIEDMLPDTTIYINITIAEDLTREIEIRGIELWRYLQ